MIYEASILRQDESIVSRSGTDPQSLLAWLLTQLENNVCRNASGIIKNLSNQHELPRVYTAHNPHFD